MPSRRAKLPDPITIEPVTFTFKYGSRCDQCGKDMISYARGHGIKWDPVPNDEQRQAQDDAEAAQHARCRGRWRARHHEPKYAKTIYVCGCPVCRVEFDWNGWEETTGAKIANERHREDWVDERRKELSFKHKAGPMLYEALTALFGIGTR